jgi:hypothetical protein
VKQARKGHKSGPNQQGSSPDEGITQDVRRGCFYESHQQAAIFRPAGNQGKSSRGNEQDFGHQEVADLMEQDAGEKEQRKDGQGNLRPAGDQQKDSLQSPVQGALQENERDQRQYRPMQAVKL